MTISLDWFNTFPYLVRDIQIGYMIACGTKLLAMGWLCYRAYKPFKKIVVDNRFLHRSQPKASQRDPSRSGRALLAVSKCSAQKVLPVLTEPEVSDQQSN